MSKSKYKITQLIDPNVQIFPFKKYIDPIQLWDIPRFWKINNEECYSNWFKLEIQKLKPIIIEYAKSGFSKSIRDKYEEEQVFLRKFAFALAEHEDILSSLFYANGYKGLLGLEYTKGQLKDFYKVHRRKPFLKEMGSLGSAIARGVWRSYNIRTYNDLLIIVFDDINKERIKYLGKKGLIIAQTELRDFWETYKIYPTSTNKKLLTIYACVTKGYWESQGITSWRMLLVKSFDRDLIKLFDEISKKPRKFSNRKSFTKAVSILKDFQRKNQKIPTNRDIKKQYQWITYAVDEGDWTKFGIRKGKWNDLLELSLKKTNQTRKYTADEEGFERAVQAALQFKEKTNKIPTSRDLPNISHYINLGKWRKSHNIALWNDFLQQVFDDVVEKRGQYDNKEGLEYAKSIIINFFNQNYDQEWRIPINTVELTCLDCKQFKELKNLGYPLKKGIWKPYGIFYWVDLLEYSLRDLVDFDKILLTRQMGNKWRGKNGLKRIKRILLKYFQNQKQFPTFIILKRDYFCMFKILYEKKKLIEFNISSYNDLLKILRIEIENINDLDLLIKKYII